jgi:serine/threonine-protein phosphatase PGAM5
MKLIPCLLLWSMAAFAQAALPPSPPATPQARTLVLVRHGHYVPGPSANPDLGPGLSPVGVAQARMAGARLAALPSGFDALFVSPLQRARDTAATISGDFPGRKFTVVDDLAECTPPTSDATITARETPADLATCQAQLERDFARFFRPAVGKPETDMLVCHGNVIRYLVTRALGVDSKSWFKMSVGHASITTIRIEADGRMRVIAVGDVGHLPHNFLTGATGNPERSLAIATLETSP